MSRPKNQISNLLEQYSLDGSRVEAVLKKGWEIRVGYGCKTQGRIVRFYVGKTSKRGIVVMVMRRDSQGGIPLPIRAIESVKSMGRHYRDKRWGTS